MFGFIAAMTFFNYNPSKVNSLQCISMNNQECKKKKTKNNRCKQ